ncbi:Slp family lipoprotein [Thalassotalea piscium]
MKSNLLFTIVLASILSACSNIPDKLQVAETTRLVPFESVKAETTANIGSSARWGGVIAKVTNNADNSMLEIVNFPLTTSARPKQKDETLGRFRVYFSGLLDPLIYKEGRSITALGTISAPEKGKIGEHEYLYPVLKAGYVHLWKNIQQVDVNIINSGYWGSSMYYNEPRYYRRPTVIRSSNTPQSKSQSPSKAVNK